MKTIGDLKDHVRWRCKYLYYKVTMETSAHLAQSQKSWHLGFDSDDKAEKLPRYLELPKGRSNIYVTGEAERPSCKYAAMYDVPPKEILVLASSSLRTVPLIIQT